MTSVGDIHSWCEMCCEFLNGITVAVITSACCIVDLLHTFSCIVQKRCTLLIFVSNVRGHNEKFKIA